MLLLLPLSVLIGFAKHSDDDMQSTFSAVSIGEGSLQFDEDDEHEMDEMATLSTITTRKYA